MTDYSCYHSALLHRYIIAFSFLPLCATALLLFNGNFNIDLTAHISKIFIRHLHLFAVLTKIQHHFHCEIEKEKVLRTIAQQLAMT